MTDTTPTLDLAELEVASADYESGAKRAPTSRVVSKWSRLCEMMYDNLPALVAKAKEAEAWQERAEHAEGFCYNAAMAAGAHGFVCAETVPLIAERDALKRITVACVNSIGNGASASEECSVDFLSYAPNEIASAISRVRAERDALKAELAAAEIVTKTIADVGAEKIAEIQRELFAANARAAELESALRPFQCGVFCTDACCENYNTDRNACPRRRATLLLQPTAAATQCGYCAGAGTDKAGQRCGGCDGTGVPAIARRAREPGGRAE